MADLSEYEKVRLENIKRNEAFLSSIGISGVQPRKSASSLKAKKRTEQKRKPAERPAAVPVRSSKRLRGVTAQKALEEDSSGDEQVEDEEEDDGKIDYEADPLGPEDLDDHEFEVFVAAKAWRLARCREMDIEPYKIFNNRAMCDIIRRRRNNAEWALSDRNDLLEAWGTAEKKLATGIPAELIQVLEDEANVSKLEASRKLSTTE